jgi:pyridoxine 4-dehydrogenase
MKEAIDMGATFWNAGVFYGVSPDGEPLNLQLIARFFTKYPDLADKVFLSVKGGVLNHVPNGTPEFLRADVEHALKYLDGKKKLDLFECARVDLDTYISYRSCINFRPIETSIGALAELVKEGKIGHIGLSEVSAESIQKANKVHPIAAVEIEYSLWATEAKDNGVLQTCKDLGIAIIAYSPIGRGILAGKFKTIDDVPQLIQERFPRFSEENFQHNLQFLHKLEEMAKKKGVTTAQLAIKWVTMVDDHVIPIPGASSLGRVKENLGAANIEMTKAEFDELSEFAASVEAKGTRYGEEHTKYLFK